MTVNISATLNQDVQVYVLSSTPVPDVSNTLVVKDGIIVVTPSLTFSSVTGVSNLYLITFNPKTTGTFAVVFNGDILAYVTTYQRSIQTLLTNIEDEALGSWVWNKTTGKLNMLRQDGSALAGFDIVENLTLASREKTS